LTIRIIHSILLAIACALTCAAQQQLVVEDDESADEVLVYDGIDVSSYQKDIDWRTTARDKNIKFVYVKATEGATYTSRHYRINMENARKHGVRVGSYHFLRTGSRIRDQFENFKNACKKNEQDLVPLIDVEVRNGWTPQQLRDSVQLFADLVEEYYGCVPMIYTSASFFNKLLGKQFARYPLFIARYSKTPPQLQHGARWTLWQFSDKGRIAGIDHHVDLCRFNKGCSLRNILIKDNRISSSKRHRNSDEVNRHREKPATVDVNANKHRSTEPPAMSKQQEKELKKKQEKERKAQERAQRLEREAKEKQAREQQKKAEKLKKEQEKKQKEEQKKAEEAAKKKKKEEAKQRARQQQAEAAAKKKNSTSTSSSKNTSKSSSSSLMQSTRQRKKQQLSQAQRNDSIRTAKQTGRKINKSSADND